MPKLEEVIRRDTLANRPSANAVATGSLFFDTTNSILYRSNGTSWESVEGSASTAHDILSATHSDTAASAVSRGSLIVGNSTPAWSELNIGSSGHVLTSDGTDAAWAAPTAADFSQVVNQSEFVEASITEMPFDRLIAGTGITLTEVGNGSALSIASSGGSGGLTLVSKQLLTGAAQSITFSSLDGNTDVLYKLSGIVKLAQNTTTFTLKANGITTNQTLFRHYNTEDTKATWELFGPVNTGVYATFNLEIAAQNNPNSQSFVRMFSGMVTITTTVPAVSLIITYQGLWNDTSTNLTSLVLDTDVAGSIANGSWLALYKYAQS